MNWSGSIGGAAELYGVGYGNRTFVAVGQCGNIVMTSDGISWKNRRSGSCNALCLNSVSFGLSTFVTVGAGGAILQWGPVTHISLRFNEFAELTLSGPPGLYRIEASDHLEDPNGWKTLSTFAVTAPPYLYIDQSATNASQRFYRTVLE